MTDRFCLRVGSGRPRGGRSAALVSCLFLLAVAVTAAGCSDPTSKPPAADVGGDGAADAGPTDTVATPDAVTDTADATDPADAAAPDTTPDAAADVSPDVPDDTGPPPAEPVVERWGTRLWSPVLGLRRVERQLWLGMTAIQDPYDPAKVRAGLARYDLDTGDVVRWEAELPQVPYTDFMVAGTGAVSTAGAIGDGQRVLVAARQGVLVVQDGKFQLQPVTVAGQAAAPVAIAVDRRPGIDRLWVTTDQGLVRLHADTFAVEQVWGAAELGSAQLGALTLDTESGAVYAVVYLDQGLPKLARVDDQGIVFLSPGDNAPKGLLGEVVWSPKAKAAYVALASWDPATGGVVRWDGQTVTPIATEGQLAQAARGKPEPFGAQVLSLDDAAGILAVGGQIHKKGIGLGLEGGGLAWVDLTQPDQLAGISAGTSDLAGDHVVSVAWDPTTKRTFVSLRQPCSDVKLGNVGVQAVYWGEDGKPRVERPVLSGVRDFVRVAGATWATLRDDIQGLSCDGHTVQQSLVRLHARRGGEVVRLQVAATDPGADPTAFSTAKFGANVLAAFDDDHVAWAGWKHELFLGDPDGGRMTNPAITFGTSLYPYEVAWQDAQTLWVASRAAHHAGDDPALGDVGPRGAAKVTLGPKGEVTPVHYVAASKDAKDVTGLPSSEVTAALPAADGSTWLVCGTERQWAGSQDRLVGEPFLFADGKPRLGGVARVAADGKVQVVADGAVVPDGRAATLDTQGRLLVADFGKGLLRLDPSGVVALPWPAVVPAGAWPTALWAGQGDDLVAGFHQGLLVRLAGKAWFQADLGAGWRALQRAPGVILAGADEGLLRIRAPGAADPQEALPGKGTAPVFQKIEAKQPDPGGQCVPLHGKCGLEVPCCPGTKCVSGFVLTCEAD